MRSFLELKDSAVLEFRLVQLLRTNICKLKISSLRATSVYDLQIYHLETVLLVLHSGLFANMNMYCGAGTTLLKPLQKIC